MNRGVLLIAHNNEKWDYYKMAVATAKRVNYFLDLPVSIITDEATTSQSCGYTFDNTYYITPDTSNSRSKTKWINKGRYAVFDYTPYSETLVLDTDYMVNSTQLTSAFNTGSDFCCHKNVKWVLEGSEQEFLHQSTVSTLWATVMAFKKTRRVEQIFEMIRMVQDNYQHYSSIYKFLPYTYRNDYALTIALKTVCGHLENPDDYFWWNLWHVPDTVKVYRDGLTSYTVIKTDKTTGKSEYLKITDMDFHVLNKQNFLDLSQ